MCCLLLFGVFESLLNLDLPDEPLGELGCSSPCSRSESAAWLSSVSTGMGHPPVSLIPNLAVTPYFVDLPGPSKGYVFQPPFTVPSDFLTLVFWA